MSTPKLQRFKENGELDNVLEYTDFNHPGADKPAGGWHRIFGNSNPLTLELACGRGDYALNLAKKYPDRNFIGIDIKGARIWKGAKKAKRDSVQNIHFVRMYVDHLDHYFAADEVSEIWITFPDPYPKRRRAGKRLTSPGFIDLYQKILVSGGSVNLKTDSDMLFRYTLSVLTEKGCKLLKQIDNIYKECPDDPLLSICTTYEKRHLQRGKTIRYLKFQLPG